MTQAFCFIVTGSTLEASNAVSSKPDSEESGEDLDATKSADEAEGEGSDAGYADTDSEIEHEPVIESKEPKPSSAEQSEQESKHDQ